MKRLNDFDGDAHAVGTLDLLARFWREPEMPAGLLPYTLALTCPVPASSLEGLPRDSSKATVSFERIQMGPHPAIAMRLVLGDIEVVWLADAQDADVWMAIDFWKEAKVVPVVLGFEEHGEERYRFFFPTMLPGVFPKEALFGWADGRGDAELWTSMIAFSESHGAAFPLVSARVPPLPRPVGFKGIKHLLSHRDSSN
jgi:hypothetical protein